jgi:hypothetical protein
LFPSFCMSSVSCLILISLLIGTVSSLLLVVSLS